MDEKNLSQIFNSRTKIRILKIFLRNPSESFNVAEISRRSRVPKSQVRSYVTSLVTIGVLKKSENAKNKKSSKNKKGKE